MRKILIRAAVIIVLLLLLFYAFLEYRQYRSYSIPVHASAEMIIKVNADAFIRNFIGEYGFNFNSKIGPSEKKEKGSVLKTGLQIPANIFIYSASSVKTPAFFCTLRLKDANDFKNYLRHQFNILLEQKGSYITGKKDKITVWCNHEFAVIAYSAGNENTEAIAEDVLSGKNLLHKEHVLIRKLKQERAHITCVTANAVVTAVFNGKKITVDGLSKQLAGIVVPAQSKKRTFSKNACASFYMNGLPASRLFKPIYTVKQYSFAADSLLQHMTGYTDAEMLGSVTEKDTVTTYEYDDNFEKTEKQTIAEVKIPKLIFLFDGSAPLLNGYLLKQGIFTTNNQINKEVFPLYTVSITGNEKQLQLQTGERENINYQFTSTPEFLAADIDFVKIRAIHNFPYLQKYTAGINRLTFTGELKKEKQLKLHGTILFEQSALKTITNLLKGM